MKTNMADTSLEAYIKIIDKLPEKRKIVYNIIKNHGPLCNEAIAIRLNWPINRVTGRVKELRELGLVKDMGKIARNGYNVHQWGKRSPVKLF